MEPSNPTPPPSPLEGITPSNSSDSKVTKVAALSLTSALAGAGAAPLSGRTSPVPAERVKTYPIGLTMDECIPFLDAATETCTKDYLLEHPECKSASKELVYKWLTDNTRKENNEKPRVEIRECIGIPLIANVALSLADSPTRDAVFDSLTKTSLHFVKAGSTTIEISSVGVNKATPIEYLRCPGNLERVLDQIDYTPGSMINAREYRTVVVSDADGTLWDKPKSGQHVESTNLFNSKAKDPILHYILAGGVLVVNTGNDPARTLRRFVVGFAGLPPDVIKTIKSRVIFSAAGGGSLYGFQKGKITEFKEYHDFSPTFHSGAPMDMLYLGDDAKAKGNDMPGFYASEDHFICVAPKSSSDQVAASSISHRVQYGEVASVHAIFTAITVQAKTNRLALGRPSGKPLFKDMEALLTNTRNIAPARVLTGEAFSLLGGRESILEFVSRSDQLNAPIKIESSAALAASRAVPPLSSKDSISYADVMAAVLGAAEKKPPSVKESLKRAGAGDELNESEIMIDAFLEQTGLVEKSLKEVSTLRVLIPGNNDQATPIYTAYQIKKLQLAITKHGGNLRNVHIQVLVMGKGGHATTAMYPQIGQIQQVSFSGTEEAVSLGTTLETALAESGIETTRVDEFSSDLPGVQVKFAKDSKNTGENVQEAKLAFRASFPDYQWVAAARTSSLRQSLTFAHQYEGCYDTLWSLPPSRSERFLRESLSDHQLMTEFYSSMAEKTRLIYYALPPEAFIPPFTNNPDEFKSLLDEVYTVYEKLNGLPLASARETAPLKKVLSFYMERFAVFERSIPWNKEQETQQAYTLSAMEELHKRGKKRAIFSALEILNDHLEKVVPADLKPPLKALYLHIKEGDTSTPLLDLCREVNRLRVRLTLLPLHSPEWEGKSVSLTLKGHGERFS